MKSRRKCSFVDEMKTSKTTPRKDDQGSTIKEEESPTSSKGKKEKGKGFLSSLKKGFKRKTEESSLDEQKKKKSSRKAQREEESPNISPSQLVSMRGDMTYIRAGTVAAEFVDYFSNLILFCALFYTTNSNLL